MTKPLLPSKRRLRFSILNLLLLTAIIALAITVVMQWREVGPLYPGEYLLRHQFYKEGDGNWVGRATIRCVEPATALTSSFSNGTGSHAWLDWSIRCAATDGVSYETDSFKRDEPIILIRHRVDKEEVGSSDEQKTPGVMIWLEPQ